MAKLNDELVSAAAGLDSDDMGDEMPAPDESEDGGKADFMRMAKAIKAGDFESAWEHYQACAGMGGSEEPMAGPLDDMG